MDCVKITPIASSLAPGRHALGNPECGESAQALSGAGASKAGPRPLSELEAGVARGPWTAVARMDVVLPVLENPVHA